MTDSKKASTRGAHFYSLTSLLSVEGHQLGAGFDVVPLAGEGTSSDIVDPSLDLKI